MLYRYKSGDGNEGNYTRFCVSLTEKDCAYTAVKALLANDYIAGKRVRRHIIANTDISGESAYTVYATVYG
jgi:isochorismate hydrolase